MGTSVITAHCPLPLRLLQLSEALGPGFKWVEFRVWGILMESAIRNQNLDMFKYSYHLHLRDYSQIVYIIHKSIHYIYNIGYASGVTLISDLDFKTEVIIYLRNVVRTISVQWLASFFCIEHHITFQRSSINTSISSLDITIKFITNISPLNKYIYWSI